MKRAIACLTILLCNLAQAQEIGRLFTSPAERAALDRARQAAKAPPGKAQEASVKDEPVALPAEGEQILMVNGVVRRSGSGRETIWVDAVPHLGSAQLPGGVALARGQGPGRAALTLRSGRRVSVKAGQNVDASTGQVSEAYQPSKK